MKVKIFTLAALALLALAGCSKTEPTVIDQNAAKAQPGADTPAAQPPSGASEAAQKAEKEGK